MQRTTQPPRAAHSATASSDSVRIAMHARTASEGAVQPSKLAAQSAHSSPIKKTIAKSTSAHTAAPQQRRALQPLDGNRIGAVVSATAKSSLIKPTPFAYVSRFTRPHSAASSTHPSAAVGRTGVASSAPVSVTSATSLTGLKRKQRELEVLVVQQQQPKPKAAPVTVTQTQRSTKQESPLEQDEDQDLPQRENIAWLDMLVALLERKYQAHQPPVCVDDLEEAKMLELYWKRRTPAPESVKAEMPVKSEPSSAAKRVRLSFGGEVSMTSILNAESEKEERRQQALRRHAQQIQDSSVASTACCGCKTGCLKMYCVCFSTRGYCNAGCNCDNCKNARSHADQRLEAITTYLANDPRAFSYAASASSKSSGFFQLLPEKSSTVVLRGCRCKKSKCLKKYCECFQNGLGCSAHCRCVDCSNDASAEARELRAKNKAASATPGSVSGTAGAFHAIQVAVTKKPRRNFVHKSLRLSLS